MVACSDAPDPDLMAQARSAVLELLDDPSSTRFDDSNVVALQAEGLVCGGRVKFRTEWGEYTDFQPYYFHIHRGAALPGHDAALSVTLMRECARAVG